MKMMKKSLLLCLVLLQALPITAVYNQPTITTKIRSKIISQTVLQRFEKFLTKFTSDWQKALLGLSTKSLNDFLAYANNDPRTFAEESEYAEGIKALLEITKKFKILMATIQKLVGRTKPLKKLNELSFMKWQNLRYARKTQLKEIEEIKKQIYTIFEQKNQALPKLAPLFNSGALFTSPVISRKDYDSWLTGDLTKLNDELRLNVFYVVKQQFLNLIEGRSWQDALFLTPMKHPFDLITMRSSEDKALASLFNTERLDQLSIQKMYAIGSLDADENERNLHRQKTSWLESVLADIEKIEASKAHTRTMIQHLPFINGSADYDSWLSKRLNRRRKRVEEVLSVRSTWNQ